MNRQFVVTGTDTDIGKTVFCAALTAALGASYWKPVQAGLDGGTDSERIANLTGLSTEGSPRIHPEAHRLVTPASPHLAAEIDGVLIDPFALTPPACEGPLVIEGAGGALVPVTRTVLFADMFARWELPVIICARTGLGTINHTLAMIESLRLRQVSIHGIAFIGDAMPDSEAVIPQISGVPRLGRLPRLEKLNRDSLLAAFHAGFDLKDFQ